MNTHNLLKTFTADAKEQSAFEYFMALSAQSGEGKIGEYLLQKNNVWICFVISPTKAHVLGGEQNLDKEMPVQDARNLYKKMLSEGWKIENPTDVNKAKAEKKPKNGAKVENKPIPAKVEKKPEVKPVY